MPEPLYCPSASSRTLSAAAAVFRYEEPTRSFLFYLKRNDNAAAFRLAAQYMLSAAAHLPLTDGTVFVNVPRARGSIRRYGFDHASLLAAACARLSPFSSRYVPLLRRRPWHDAEQKTLDAEQRAVNTSDRFYVNLRTVNRMRGASAVVIVDDVVTTGSSVCECASVISKSIHDVPLFALSLVQACRG